MTNWLSPRIIFPLLHASLGWGIVLSFVVFLPAAGFVFALLALEAVLVLKEAAWDPRYEVAQPFLWQGAKDLAWYQVGIGLLVVALGLLGRL